MFFISTYLSLERTSPERFVKKVHGLYFLAVNDFCVYLGRFHVGVPEQLAGRVKVCPKGEHHRGERVPAGME